MSKSSSFDVLAGSLAAINALERDALQYTMLHSWVRSLLQWSAISAVECAASVADDVTDTRLPEIAQHLLHPVDGSLGPAIEYSLVQLSIAGINDPLDQWLTDRPLPGGSASAAATANRWTAYRNDRAGHGVVSKDEIAVGTPTLQHWADLLLRSCKSVLPTEGADGLYVELHHRGAARPHVVSVPLLRFSSGHSTVIRRIRLRGDAWTVTGQELDIDSGSQFNYQIPTSGNFLRLLSEDVSRYRTHVLGDSPSSTQLLLPQRQTDAFTGRKSELTDVVEWICDLESRVCNVYGEGGIGKTTLVLEALHRIVDGRVARDVPPLDVVCFYSSKLTRYGPEGLERIGGITPSVADAAREVARCYYEQLNREWFGKDPTYLVERAGQLLRELGIARDRVLIILDNTETLMTSVADRDALAAAVDLMARKVGRILITSRNREKVEARPIALGPLPESEAEQLLLKLAQEEGAKPLLQTGTSGRRRIVRKFKGKPLLIEVFARMVAQQNLSLDRAEKRVMERAEADLGLFLYEDAWERFNATQRNVMLALVQIDNVVTSRAIGFACSALECSHPEMFEALEENRFAQIQDYGSQYDIVFDSLASAFLRGKLDALPGSTRVSIDQCVASVQRRLREASLPGPAAVEKFSEAFATDAARAAWMATKKGDIEEAHLWYEEAIRLEPDNAALHHRYAFFLTRHVGDLRAAARMAFRACDIAPDDPDCWFVLANVTARQGDVGGTDNATVRATRAGFAESHRTALLQARARVNALARDVENLGMAREASQFLDASRLRRVQGRLDEKHMEEVEKVSRLLSDLKR